MHHPRGQNTRQGGLIRKNPASTTSQIATIAPVRQQQQHKTNSIISAAQGNTRINKKATPLLSEAVFQSRRNSQNLQIANTKSSASLMRVNSDYSKILEEKMEKQFHQDAAQQPLKSPIRSPRALSNGSMNQMMMMQEMQDQEYCSQERYNVEFSDNQLQLSRQQSIELKYDYQKQETSHEGRVVGPNCQINLLNQPRNLSSLLETPATGSIEDLTLDIADLNQPIQKAQARPPQQAYPSVQSSHELALEQQRLISSHVAVQQKKILHNDNLAYQTNKNLQKFPTSPKSSYRNHLEQAQKLIQHQPPTDAFLAPKGSKNYGKKSTSSISKTSLQIADPNRRLVNTSQHTTPSNAQMQNSHNKVAANSIYSFPNQNEKRHRQNEMQLLKNSYASLTNFLTRNQNESVNKTKNSSAACSSKEQIPTHRKSRRSPSLLSSEAKSITRQQTQQAKLLGKGMASTAMGLDRSQQRGSKRNATNTAGQRPQKNPSLQPQSKQQQISHNDAPISISQTQLVDLVEKRVSHMLDQRLKSQEQKFMSLLERVIEGNEAVKSQMQIKIMKLQTRVEELERLQELFPRSRLQTYHEAEPTMAWTATQQTQVIEGEQNLQSEAHLDTMELEGQKSKESLIQARSQPQQTRKLPGKPAGVEDLILVEEENFAMLGNNAVGYSPISALEGIDFGKVLSTRGDKTFINELNGVRQEFERAGNEIGRSPMPKLNLSALSDPTQLKQISRREIEILERINKLKQDDRSGFKSHTLGRQAVPLLLQSLQSQTNAATRNHGTGPQSVAVPQIVLDQKSTIRYQHEPDNLTGRSENVQDTHRSSVVDSRHQEHLSLRPIQRDSQTMDDFDDEDSAMKAASNEQHSLKQHYHRIRNKRTNSLHQSRDISFLSNYNASLIGMNTSLNAGRQNFIAPQPDKQKASKSNKMMVQLSQDDLQNKSQFTAQLNNLISPISPNGYQSYFSDEKSVQLANCQYKVASKLPPPQQKAVEDIKDQINEENPTKNILRESQKINSRSVSYQFAGDCSDIIENGGGGRSTLKRSQWGSPPLTKSIRHTNTSIVQQGRKLNLSQSVGPSEHSAIDEDHRINNQVNNSILIRPDTSYKCTCPRLSLAAQRQRDSVQFAQAQAINVKRGMSFQSARLHHHDSQSVQGTPMTKVFQAERLSSLIDMSRFNSQISDVKHAQTKEANEGPNVAPLQTQTDIQESIADEDAPLKIVHGETEPKMTEINQTMPAIPAGFRSDKPSTFNTKFYNTQPCGEYCQWLTAEAQRDIIRTILTSTQGNTVLKASNGKPGEKRFLVNSVWWRKWTDYVNFDLVEVEQPSMQQERLLQQRQKSHSTSRYNHSGSKKFRNSFAGTDAEALGASTLLSVVADLEQDGGKSSCGGALNASFMNELMSLKRSKSKPAGSTIQQDSYKSAVPQSISRNQEVNASLSSASQCQQQRKTTSDANANTLNEESEEAVDARNVLEEGKNETYTNLARIVPSLKNSGVTMRTSNNLNLYARPGPVENYDLLQKRNCLALKSNLIEHHNFVALPLDIWRHIYSWYSADWSIVRFLRRDTAQGVMLDLYPTHGGERHETAPMDTDGDGALATCQ